MAIGKTNSGSTATTPLEIMERIGIADALNTLISEAILENNKANYPVGKIVFETENVNPATYLGFGTWEPWGSGRVPVGVDTAQTEFATVEKKDGEKTHTLTKSELAGHTHTGPSHYHTVGAHSHNLSNHTHTTTISGYTNTDGAHVHSISYTNVARGTASNNVRYIYGDTSGDSSLNIGNASSSHRHYASLSGTSGGPSASSTANSTAFNTGNAGTDATGSAGNNAAHNNLQPYITCYMWKRTA